MTAVTTGANATVAGAGIAVDAAGSAQSTITNSTVTENAARATVAASGSATAGAEGGGIYVASSALRLVNATVARNRLTAQGSAHFAVGGGIYSSVATLQLRGTLLAGNSAGGAPECSGPMSSLGYNLIAKMAGCTGLTAKPSDRRNTNAKLGTFGLHGGATRTVALKKGSPALNRIPKTSCKVKSDQRGVKRPEGEEVRDRRVGTAAVRRLTIIGLVLAALGVTPAAEAALVKVTARSTRTSRRS